MHLNTFYTPTYNPQTTPNLTPSPALVLFPVAEVPPNPTEGGDLQLLPIEDSQPSASEVRLIWKTCADILKK